MTAHTNRVTTPLGAESTAAEVLEGLDLSAKRMIITGASSGSGSRLQGRWPAPGRR